MLKARSTITILCACAALASLPTALAAAAPLPVPYGQTASNDSLYNQVFAPTSVPGANNGCIPTAAHPYPVVLVHGTFSDEGDVWMTLSPLLSNAGYCVYAFNYGETDLSFDGRVNGLGEIAASAGQLQTFVNQVLSETGASKVDIVGHSQGGMMPNYYIKFLGGASKVNTFVGLAASNHGTTIQGLVTDLQGIAPSLLSQINDVVYEAVPAVVEQEVGSAFETNLFASGDTVPGPRYVVIETEHDEVITPYTNAFLSGPNVTDITIQNQCPNDPVGHINMQDDSPAMQNVLNQLANTPDPTFTATCTNYGLDS